MRLEKRFDERFSKIDERFEKVDARFDEMMKIITTFAEDVYRRFDNHDAQLRELRETQLEIHDTIDDFAGRKSIFESELTAQRSKLNRIAPTS